ncbi:hypothetical protein [Magnetospira sp. QH-2]|uniref:hypothetical protein n=1 Tax=Magnetospira sp. (strain QH-2) TaxID=1288970 RepID=UPI0003E81023|nr:hypothetical protein [Magnetospira sp. QH-2]CCQ73002.1 Magnetosome protein MamS [Magnetospira sp. QH-2]
MKIENWIFLFGIVVILGIAGAAMLPEHLWEDDFQQFEMSAGSALSVGPGGIPGIQGNAADPNLHPGHVQGQGQGRGQGQVPKVGPMGPPTAQTALWGPESGQMIAPNGRNVANLPTMPFMQRPQSAQQPQQQAQPPKMAGLVPFRAAKTVRYQGRVERVVHRGAAGTPGAGWGQMHIWVADGVNPVQEVSVAPDWWVVHLGCNVQKGSYVRGVAFQFDQRQRPESFIYAKTLVLNGKLCQMRNDEGFAIWSNQLN